MKLSCLVSCYQGQSIHFTSYLYTGRNCKGNLPTSLASLTKTLRLHTAPDIGLTGFVLHEDYLVLRNKT